MKKSITRYYITGIILIVIVGLVLFVIKQTSTIFTTDDKLSVVVTLYPWQYLAEQVGGDFVNVTNIVPLGAEPHDFAPLPKDLVSVYDSDVFITNGAGIEPWAERLTEADFTAPQHVTLVMTAETDLLTAESEPEGDDHEFDPHIWLDPTIMQAKAETIRATLSALDPEHAFDYERNARAVIADLEKLDTNFIDGLSQCEQDAIIVSHDAFTYFGERYNITLHPILGMNPNATPSARALAELTDLAQSQSIDTIFFESLISPNLAETIASEVGAQTLVLNPLEGLTTEQMSGGDDYINLMQANLLNLQIALHCQK